MHVQLAIARRAAFLILIGAVVTLIVWTGGMPWSVLPAIALVGPGCMLDLYHEYRKKLLYIISVCFVLAVSGTLYVTTHYVTHDDVMSAHIALWILVSSTWTTFLT